MRTPTRACLWWLVLLLIAGGARGQSGGTLQVSSAARACHPEDNPCSTVIAQDSTATLYVVMAPDTAMTNGGITGASLQILGMDPGLLAVAIPSPAASITLGDLFSGGVHMAFPDCQRPGPDGVLVLFTLTVTNVTGAEGVRLIVDQVWPPTNPSFTCPLVYACDPPLFTAWCVEGIAFEINPTVAVSRTSWGAVKRLYHSRFEASLCQRDLSGSLIQAAGKRAEQPGNWYTYGP